MFLALSDPVISDLLINMVVWLVRRGPVGVSEKQEIFNNCASFSGWFQYACYGICWRIA